MWDNVSDDWWQATHFSAGGFPLLWIWPSVLSTDRVYVGLVVSKPAIFLKRNGFTKTCTLLDTCCWSSFSNQWYICGCLCVFSQQTQRCVFPLCTHAACVHKLFYLVHYKLLYRSTALFLFRCQNGPPCSLNWYYSSLFLLWSGVGLFLFKLISHTATSQHMASQHLMEGKVELGRLAWSSCLERGGNQTRLKWFSTMAAPFTGF